MDISTDDRVRCQDCRRYKAPRCAHKGQRKDVPERYEPTTDLPHRCIFFSPVGTNGPHGWHLFPDLVAIYKEQYVKRNPMKEAA